jgi:glycosyltransferase involved in cell wall biosynthesis
MSSVPVTEPNPYFRLFYSALSAHDVELVGTFEPTRRWLRAHADIFDVLHFHWPEWIIRSDPAWLRAIDESPGVWRLTPLLRPAAPWTQIREYRAFLDAARALGKGIAWTCHNVDPHEDASWPVRAAFRALARAADLVICHDASASAECEALYGPRGRIVVMEHGNYDGVYPAPRPREVVRREIGLDPAAPLLVCVGQVRPYKAVDVACDAVAQLGGAVSLLIVGHAPIASYAREIKERVARLPHAVFVDRHLSDPEFADYVGASDLVLLPYRSITGSGSALAALSLGRAVVASDLPFFADLLRDHPDAGRIFPSEDVRAMGAAISSLLEVAPAQRERAARALAAQFDWARLVPPIAKQLRELRASG